LIEKEKLKQQFINRALITVFGIGGGREKSEIANNKQKGQQN
jgi:hypothetical protein